MIRNQKGERSRSETVTVLLPTDTNKLLLSWKGPYEVTEVVNELDYKVKVNGKAKVYHANLLCCYEQREEAPRNKEKMEIGAIGIAVIEPEIEKLIGVVDDENLLDIGNLNGTESGK